MSRSSVDYAILALPAFAFTFSAARSALARELKLSPLEATSCPLEALAATDSCPGIRVDLELPHRVPPFRESVLVIAGCRFDPTRSSSEYPEIRRHHCR